MKDAWCLASNIVDATGTELVKLYGRRFTIEEAFRDAKNLRFGMGLAATRIGDTNRRDRMLLLGAMAQALLTLLGVAAEEVGLDKTMKVNTVKRRTHSLFRQGLYWFGAIPNMKQERLELLITAYGRIVSQHAVFTRRTASYEGIPQHSHACARVKIGRIEDVWCWGDNSKHQLGRDFVTSDPVPGAVQRFDGPRHLVRLRDSPSDRRTRSPGM